jgi:TP901 family phage tail tape measure protein
MPSPNSIRAGSAFVELYVRDKVTTGLTKAAASLKAFSRVADRVGMQMMRTGAMMAVPIAVAGKAFMEFEHQMAEVSTMIDQPSAGLKHLGMGVLKASVQFGIATDDIAKGLYNILSAAIPAEDSLQLLGTSSRAAVAGLSSVAQSADTITGVLNAYGLEASEAERVSDILFTTVKRGKTTFSELSNNLGKLTAIAATAGITMEEVGASIATVTRNAIPTDITITGLRQAFSTLLKPASQSAEMFEKMFGMKMNSESLKSMGGMVGMMEKLSTLSNEEIATIFPDRRALTAILPMVRNLDALRHDMGLMNDSAGATEAAYEKMTSTLKHVFNTLVQSGKALFVVIGGILGDSFRELGTNIEIVFSKAEYFLRQNKELVVSFFKWTGILLTSGAALKVLSFVIGAFAPLINVLTSLLNRLVLGPLFMLGKMLLVISPMILGFMGIIAGLNYVMGWGLNVFEMFTYAIVFAVAAIGIYKAAVLVATVVQTLWTAAVTTFRIAAALASNVWLLAAAGIIGGFAVIAYQTAKTEGTFAGFGESSKRTFTNIKNDAITSFSAITDAIKMGDFEAASEMAVLGLKAIWGSLWAWLKDGWRRLADTITLSWQDLGHVLVALGLDLWGALENGWSHFAEFSVNTLSKLGNLLINMFMSIGMGVAKAFHFMTGLGPSAKEIDREYDLLQQSFADAQKKRADEAAADRKRTSDEISLAKALHYQQNQTLGADLAKIREEKYKEDMEGVEKTRKEMKALADQIAKNKAEFDANKPEIKQGLLSDPGAYDRPLEEFSDDYIDSLVDSVSGGVGEEIEDANLPDIEIPQLDNLNTNLGGMNSGLSQAAQAIALGQQGAFGAASNLRNIQGIFGKAAKWENQVIDKLDQMNGYMRSIDMTEKKQLRNLTW